MLISLVFMFFSDKIAVDGNVATDVEMKTLDSFFIYYTATMIHIE